MGIRFVTKKDAVRRYIGPALGNQSRGYDLDKISDEVLRPDPEGGFSPSVTPKEFWGIVAKHAVLPWPSYPMARCYNISRDVFLQANDDPDVLVCPECKERIRVANIGTPESENHTPTPIW